MIVASSTPAVATMYVRLVLWLLELYGHGPALGASIQVRGVQQQGALW